jgi:hypothetical protein
MQARREVACTRSHPQSRSKRSVAYSFHPAERRKESSSPSHAREKSLILNFLLIGSVSDGLEVALNWLFPYPI